MAQLLVRQLDAAVVERLKHRAADRGASLEAFAREVLTRAAADERPAVLMKVDALRAGQPPQRSNSTDLVRQRRDAGEA